MRHSLLILSLLSLYSFISAQQKCIVPLQKAVSLENPDLDLRNEEITIPLVFHIAYPPNVSAISEKNVLAQIEQLNTAFNKTESNIAGNVGFRFKLAEVDPDENITDGINEVFTSIAFLGDLTDAQGISSIKKRSDGGIDPWNSDRYVNIWVGERSISLGATIAANAESEDLEGIILDLGEVIGNTKTIVHEMGHLFGLLHPWGNNTGCDMEDDGITDTPFQQAPIFVCKDEYNCTEYVPVGNFMDFSPDECLTQFTKLQALAMQAFIVQYKNDFIDQQTCFPSNLPAENQILLFSDEASIHFYYTSEDQLNDVALYSMTGQLILIRSELSENYLKISRIGIPPGLYVLKYKSGEKPESQVIYLN